MSYSTLAEFALLGMSAAAQARYPVGAPQAALNAAQKRLHGYFRAADLDVPLPSPDEDVKLAECQIAAWILVSVHGRDAVSEGDATLETNYRTAIKWCEDVAAGKVQPVAVVDQVTQDADTAFAGGYAVVSDTARGWDGTV